MSSQVEVGNFDEMRLGLKKELSILSKKLGETLKSSSKLNVNVDHLKELIQVIIKLMEVIGSIEFRPHITHDVNIPEIKVPDVIVPEIKVPSVYVPEPRVTVNPSDVHINVQGIIDALENLKFLSDRPNKPLSVRMSDGNKFVKAIEKLKESTDNLGVVYAGQSGITIDEIRGIGLGLSSTIGSGNRTVTTAGTRVQLSTSSVAIKWVEIVAKEANTSNIWVGGSNVANGTGRPLVGLQSIRIETNDLSNIWLDSQVNGEGVTYVYAS